MTDIAYRYSFLEGLLADMQDSPADGVDLTPVISELDSLWSRMTTIERAQVRRRRAVRKAANG